MNQDIIYYDAQVLRVYIQGNVIMMQDYLVKMYFCIKELSVNVECYREMRFFE